MIVQRLRTRIVQHRNLINTLRGDSERKPHQDDRQKRIHFLFRLFHSIELHDNYYINDTEKEKKKEVGRKAQRGQN